MTTYYQIQMAVKPHKKHKKVSKKVDGNKFVKQAERKQGINAPTNYYRHFDKKRFWIIFGVTAGIFAILLILSCTVDFDISWALASSKFQDMWMTKSGEMVPTDTFSYYSNNGWDNLVEAFAESIGFLICTFGLWLMAFPFFFVDKKKKVWYRTTSQIIIPSFLIVTAIFVMYYYNNSLGWHSYLKIVHGSTSDNMNRFVSALFSIIISASMFVVIWFFKQQTRISLAKLGFLMVMAFILSEVIVWTLKYAVDLNRERFRAIMCDKEIWRTGEANKDAAYALFVPWWEKTPSTAEQIWKESVPAAYQSDSYVKNAFSSFPSGHSSLASCALTLCFLPCCCEKANNKEWKGYFIWLILFAVVLTVMWSRVGAGAHWLSDTTIGFFCGTVPALLLGLLIFRVPQVSNFFQGMNINGQWYQFVFIPVILPVVIWLITNVLPWY